MGEWTPHLWGASPQQGSADSIPKGTSVVTWGCDFGWQRVLCWGQRRSCHLCEHQAPAAQPGSGDALEDRLPGQEPEGTLPWEPTWVVQPTQARPPQPVPWCLPRHPAGPQHTQSLGERLLPGSPWRPRGFRTQEI